MASSTCEPEIRTGIDWAAVRAELDSMDWEEMEPDRQERLCFLGTVFALYPSGKYYTQFACSNLDPCPRCGGHGVIPSKRQTPRRRKKWNHRMERLRNIMAKRGYIGNPEKIDGSAIGRAFRRLQALNDVPDCAYCGGTGSREAYLDELFGEKLESEAEEHGLYITSGEGDPCDVFAGECHDVETEDEEESEGDARDRLQADAQ
ncbi:MAG: hypothetical protein L0312_20090 [Acidobacteria bacterium]|nr:hypothetical protein [Acidobacteriota bacterium]